jgi:hypothetical protein
MPEGVLMPDSAEQEPPDDAAHDRLHGAAVLSPVRVDTYNAELRDEEGFVGDRASRRAFGAVLGDWRGRLRKATGVDPFGNAPGERLGKARLAEVLARGEQEAAGAVLGAVEDFAQELFTVVRRFLRLREWRGTERIAVGGGFRSGRIGELAIARAAALLLAEGHSVELQPIRHHPDEAGLIGGAQLAPPWIFAGHDALLAVDIGGTNIRAGVVRPRLGQRLDLRRACLWRSELWRHAEGEPGREEAVERLGAMLRCLVRRAERHGLRLAPFIAIGCPGLIRTDGRIERGGQNLPGDWEGNEFSLPRCVRAALPAIAGHETMVVVHNDAVVQGLSEAPFMRDVERWGVLTIGTGLGNARFTNRAKPGDQRA